MAANRRRFMPIGSENRMSERTALMLVACNLCLAWAAPVDRKADALLSEVEKTYRAAKTLTADMTEVVTAKGKTVTKHFMVKLKKPNLIREQQSDVNFPEEVCNGKLRLSGKLAKEGVFFVE